MKMYKDYLRSSVFGFEDALVSTTGVVIGMSTGTHNKAIILLAAVVTVVVEAVSMGAGQYVSERTLHQVEKEKHEDSLIVGAFIMFLSYAIAGLLPILPIIFFNFPIAQIFSLISAFTGLFVLGYVKGKIAHVSKMRSAIEMLLIGGIATSIGIVAGQLFKIS